jgi:TonB family protein
MSLNICLMSSQGANVSRVISRFLSSLLGVAVLSTSLIASGADAQRKAKLKIPPQYPDVARRMNITGSVRLAVQIAPNGMVKTVTPLGGHPLLIDSAVSAVKKWKYEPGDENTEIVEFQFSPHQEQH